MSPSQPSMVVLIRAWQDDDGVRGVVMIERGERSVRRVPAASVQRLCEIAEEALTEWERRR